MRITHLRMQNPISQGVWNSSCHPERTAKEIQIILRLFLVIATYLCTVKPVQFKQVQSYHYATLTSLINVEPTFTDFEKFHPPQNKNPPSSFIDFLDFATLHSSFIRFYVLVFSKNSTLLVYSKLHV